jgi:hypothetical protein
MLRHSLIAAFSALLLFAVHADPVTISAQLALASKLSARLDLRAYDEWQALIFHQLLSKKLS